MVLTAIFLPNQLLLISSYFLMEVLIKTKLIKKQQSARGSQTRLQDLFLIAAAAFL
jgi:hypothetical protein